MIADIWGGFDPGVIGWVGLSFVALAIFLAAAFAALNGGRQFFGRKPTIDEDFRSQQKTLDKLQQSLAGLAPNEKIHELVSRLGQFATQEQIRALELKLPEYIKREELERCLADLERDFGRQMTEMRSYVHERTHELRSDLQAMQTASDVAREGLHQRVNALVEVTFENRGVLSALTERLEAISGWLRKDPRTP